MSSAPSQSITSRLLTARPPAFALATKHPFLRLAGTGTLPKTTLQTWLAQDRLYTHSYITFASRLLSTTTLPLTLQNSTSLNERVTEWLVGAIANVWRESKFFEDIAGRWDLDLRVEEKNEGVVGYDRVFGEANGLWEGILVLWATEKCYLDAWRYAASMSPEGATGWEADEDGGVTRKELIPNWSSKEFETFVDEVGKLLDECFENEKGDLKRAEELWDQVLEVEQIFWPKV